MMEKKRNWILLIIFIIVIVLILGVVVGLSFNEKNMGFCDVYKLGIFGLCLP
jgi:hypothetical protein